MTEIFSEYSSPIDDLEALKLENEHDDDDHKTYPDCPSCKTEMKKFYELYMESNSGGHGVSKYFFQCPACKTVAVCGKERFDGWYFIISEHGD